MTEQFKAVEKLIDILNPLIVCSERGYAYDVDGYIITKWCKSQSDATREMRNVLAGYIERKRQFSEHVKQNNADEERIKAWLHDLSKRKNARHVAAAELHFNKAKYVSLVMEEANEVRRNNPQNNG